MEVFIRTSLMRVTKAKMRYGKEVNEQVFENINRLYMGAGEMDKDTFTRDYKKHEESMLLQVYFEKSEAQAKTISHLKQLLGDLADEAIKTGAEYDPDLLQVVERQIGRKNLILRKIALKIELEDDDLKYVSENLI